MAIAGDALAQQRESWEAALERYKLALEIDRKHLAALAGLANTLKDLGYICDLLSETSDAHKLAENMLSLYREAFEKGLGSKFLSARLDPKSYEAN